MKASRFILDPSSSVIMIVRASIQDCLILLSVPQIYLDLRLRINRYFKSKIINMTKISDIYIHIYLEDHIMGGTFNIYISSSS